MNLATTLHQAAARQPDAVALINGAARPVTYAQWSETVSRFAGALLQRFALERGDRVCISMRNRSDYLTVLYGCWHAGLCAVPANAKLHPRELAFIAESCGARLCVSDSAAFDTGSSRQQLDIEGPEFAAMCTGPSVAVCEVRAEEPAWIFFTSGTTGRPKGATLTHRNLMAMSLSYFADYGDLSPGHCMLHAAPMSHGSGLYALPFTMKAAAHIVPTCAHFDPAELIDTINAHRRVTLFLAPTMITRLLDCPRIGELDAERIEQIIYGGAPMFLEDLNRALDAFGPRLAQLYGQGESPMTITALTREQHVVGGMRAPADVLESSGTPRTGVEVRILDHRGVAAPHGEVGEIAVRGDVVMAGYWNDVEATARAFHKGWLLTGDLGSFGAGGRLTLKGRSKELIISGGSNIYPREVEEVLLEHPALREVAVIGVPDADWGEAVLACVACNGELRVSDHELHAFCLERIARFKRPKRYVFMTDLPKNAAGKIDKLELQRTLSGL